MDLASEIKSIMHDIDAASVKVSISLMAFIKDLFPTYSHYLESLQASGQLKSLTFDPWWRKLHNIRKLLGRRQFNPLERFCTLIKRGRINHMILLEEKVVREDVEEEF